MKPCTVDFDWIDEYYAKPDPWSEPTEDCPDLGRLRAAAAAELPLEERCAVLDHATRCRYCSESWRLALRLGARPEIPFWRQFLSILWADLRFLAFLPRYLARSAPVRVLVRYFKAPWPRDKRWRLVSLTPLAVTALGLVLMVAGPPRKGGHRGGKLGPPGSAAASGVVSLVPDLLPRERFVLRWSGPSEAIFDLRVITPEGRLLDSATDLTVPEYQVSEGKLHSLDSGAVLTWDVEARLADGRRVDASRFQVRLE